MRMTQEHMKVQEEVDSLVRFLKMLVSIALKKWAISIHTIVFTYNTENTQLVCSHVY